MKKLMIVTCLSALATASTWAATWTVDGYTYSYDILANGGVNIRPILNTSSHNTEPAVSPSPSGDFAIPDYLPDANTNFLSVVNIGYQPIYGRYAGTAKAFSSSSMTSVVIPDAVTNIDMSAFADCTSLVSVRLPTNLKTMGMAVFANCPKLTEVDLPDGLIGIGGNAFSGCLSLGNIAFPEGTKYIGENAFSSGYFYNTYGLSGNFKPCTNLTSVTIPGSVTNIGISAFSGCTGLQRADIGGGDIGGGAFSGCISLVDVTLGENVTSIGKSAFSGCTNLTEIIIPDNVASIGNYAFYGCTNLTRIVLGNGVRNIGNYAFQGCTNLIEIVIPNGVTNIGAYAFMGCSSMHEIIVPDSIQTVGERAFSDCSSMTNVSIGTGLKTLGRYAFYQCTSLETAEINGGDVGEYAFTQCSKLRSVSFGDNVSQVGAYAFSYRAALTTVTFGNNITNIGREAFNNCRNLTGVILPTSLKTLDYRAFGCTGITELEIPPSVLAVYASFYGCTNLTNVVIRTGVSHDSGQTVRIGVRDLDNAFGECSALVSINLPDTVTNIKSAFSGCISLSHIDLPESLGNLGDYTFHGCTSLNEIVIPDSVTNIGANAFSKNPYNGNMAYVVLGRNVEDIGYKAFDRQYPGKIYCRGALPANGAYNLPRTKYVVYQQHLASWLPWFTENTISNYAILDETTQEEVRVALGNGGVESVGIMAALGLSPARSTDADGAVATYAMPEVSIASFDPTAGVVSVLVSPDEGGGVSGDLVASCVTVEGSNDLSGWTTVPVMSIDATAYRQTGTEGRFSCTFDSTTYRFYRVKITAR